MSIPEYPILNPSSLNDIINEMLFRIKIGIAKILQTKFE